MQVYTYCSYKSSPSGYQFAIFDLDSAEEQVSSLPTKEVELSGMLPETVREWLWNRSGWKMVLYKNKEADGGGYLLLRNLENAQDLRKEAELVTRPDLLESDFFLNVALEGPIEELKQLAAGVLNAIRTDGGLALLSGFEELISKCGGQKEHSYTISLEKFRDLMQRHRYTLDKMPALPRKSNRERFSLLARFRRSVVPQITLPPESGQRDFRLERRRRTGELIGTLLYTKDFSEELLLYVSDGSAPDAYGTANLAVSLEYLLSVIESELR